MNNKSYYWNVLFILAIFEVVIRDPQALKFFRKLFEENYFIYGNSLIIRGSKGIII
jgi:hypothetical protein